MLGAGAPLTKSWFVASAGITTAVLTLAALLRLALGRRTSSSPSNGPDASARPDRWPAWLVASTVTMLAVTVTVIATPPPQQHFTEMAWVGADGRPTCLPDRFEAGAYATDDPSCDQPGTILLHISNHEGRGMTYRVELGWSQSLGNDGIPDLGTIDPPGVTVAVDLPPPPQGNTTLFLTAILADDAAPDTILRNLWLPVDVGPLGGPEG